jgi:hypothetical protein
LAAAGTMLSGKVYRLPPLVPRISGTVFSFWPTPTVGDATGGRTTSKGKPYPTSLNGAVRGLNPKFWPTPKSSPSGPDYARINRAGSGGDDLATAVARSLWPTPRSADWKGAVSKTKCTARRVAIGQANLPEAVQEATPNGGQLNPQWVEWLMGFPLGWTDLEG